MTDLESELVELNGNAERLQKSFSELVELQLVLEKAGSFFDDAQQRATSAAFDRPDCAQITLPLLCFFPLFFFSCNSWPTLCSAGPYWNLQYRCLHRFPLPLLSVHPPIPLSLPPVFTVCSALCVLPL